MNGRIVTLAGVALAVLLLAMACGGTKTVLVVVTPTNLPATPTSAANSSLADDCLDFLNGLGDENIALEQLDRERIDLLSEGTTASRTSRWQNDMRSVDRRVQVVRDAVARLDAPTAAYQSIKAKFLEALDLDLAGRQKFMNGLTSDNTDLMLDGNELMERAKAANDETVAMMRAVDPLDCR